MNSQVTWSLREKRRSTCKRSIISTHILWKAICTLGREYIQLFIPRTTSATNTEKIRVISFHLFSWHAFDFSSSYFISFHKYFFYLATHNHSNIDCLHALRTRTQIMLRANLSCSDLCTREKSCINRLLRRNFRKREKYRALKHM